MSKLKQIKLESLEDIELKSKMEKAWESIIPGRRYFDLNIDREVFGIKCSIRPQGKNFSLFINIDKSVAELMNWSPKDRIGIKQNSFNKGLFRIQKQGAPYGYKLYSRKLFYDLRVTLQSIPKEIKVGKNALYVYFKKEESSIIFDVGRLLEA